MLWEAQSQLGKQTSRDSSALLQRCIQVLHYPQHLTLEDAAGVSAHAWGRADDRRYAEGVLNVAAVCAVVACWRDLHRAEKRASTPIPFHKAQKMFATKANTTEAWKP